jgi:putative DNA primase/helicase
MTPAENLMDRLGGRWRGRYGEARCPAHEDRHASLSVRDGEQSVLVKCHAGCTPTTVIAALRRDGLWSDASRRERARALPKHSPKDTRQYLLSIWRQCRSIGGTPAERFFWNRRIQGELPPSIRFHPGLRHSGTGLLLPCMAAAVQSPDRSIVGLHRTFLRADGADKAPVSCPRMMLGQIASICRTPLISFDLFSTQRGTDGLLRLSTAVGWNERPGASRAPEYPAATQNQSRRGNT